MNKTFTYKVLNEKAYHEKLNTWFFFIMVGIIYASIRLWQAPQSGLIETFVRVTVPLSSSIVIVWFIGFLATLMILFITRDLNKPNHLFSIAFNCGFDFLCKVFLNRMLQPVYHEKTIHVTPPYASGFIVMNCGLTNAVFYGHTNTMMFEQNSLLGLIMACSRS